MLLFTQLSFSVCFADIIFPCLDCDLSLTAFIWLWIGLSLHIPVCGYEPQLLRPNPPLMVPIVSYHPTLFFRDCIILLSSPEQVSGWGCPEVGGVRKKVESPMRSRRNITCIREPVAALSGKPCKQCVPFLVAFSQMHIHLYAFLTLTVNGCTRSYQALLLFNSYTLYCNFFSFFTFHRSPAVSYFFLILVSLLGISFSSGLGRVIL